MGQYTRRGGGAEITQQDQDLLLCVRKTAATAREHQYSVDMGILLHWRTDISNPPKKCGFLQQSCGWGGGT